MQIDHATPLILQHKAPTFSGVEVGRAMLVLGNFVFRAKLLGATFNGWTITITLVSGNIYILDFRSTLGSIENTYRITANTTAEFVSKIPKELPFVGSYTAAPISTGAASFFGGVEPVLTKLQKYTYPSAIDGGLFLFDNYNNTMIVTQIECTFVVAVLTEVYVYIISLDEGLSPISDEQSIFYCTKLDATHQSSVITDCKIQVMPYRAIKIVAPLAGSIRVQARREGLIS